MRMTHMVEVFLGTVLGTGYLYATLENSRTLNGSKMGNLYGAIMVYLGQHVKADGWGTYPASLDELAQFAYKHLDLGKPLLKEGDLIDAWGQPFEYETDGRDWFFIRSSGPDKVMGTADDRFWGFPSVHRDEAMAKAKQTPAVTNAAQKAMQTGGAASPSFLKRWFGKRGGAVSPPHRAEGSNGIPAGDETKPNRLWLYALIPLCLLGAVAAWRYFRKRKRE